MINNYTYKPKQFFLIVFAITWIAWFLSAYYSYRADGQLAYILLLVPGLIAPFVTALWIILNSKSAELKAQFRARLFDLRLIKPISILPILLIMPSAVVISTLISVLFGQSINQLRFADGFSFSAGFVPVLLILVLAATFEELGWRSYAMDSLNAYHDYFRATLIFAVLWAFWHLPLFFINGYYQNEIFKMNVWYGVNFFISVIPLAFIISWLCKMNRGSIVVAILFHFFINICQEALQITQVTKCIETFVLFIIAGIIVIFNQKLFFGTERFIE